MTIETQTQSLALPSEQEAKMILHGVREFHVAVRANLIKDVDYGVIAGTQRPTLLKPGAEKITKLLNLADYYEILSRTENWDRGFFSYEVRCVLKIIGTDHVVSTGLGSCNSMESKYRYRWVFKSEMERLKVKADELPKRIIRTRNGMADQYRVENDDIYSQVNTLLKMAKKRAQVDAALSAGRLSELFTQDMEDLKADDYASVIEGDGKVLPENARQRTNSQVSSSDPPRTSPNPPGKEPDVYTQWFAELKQRNLTKEDGEKWLGSSIQSWIKEGKSIDQARQSLPPTTQVKP